MNKIKTIVVSLGLLVSASQSSDRAAAASSSQSVEPDYSLINTLEKLGGASFRKAIGNYAEHPNFPMIVHYFGLPHDSEMFIFCDNHSNPAFKDVIAKLMNENAIDIAFCELEMINTWCAASKIGMSHHTITFDFFINQIQKNNGKSSAVAIDYAIKTLGEKEIAIKPLEFNLATDAVKEYTRNGLTIEIVDLIFKNVLGQQVVFNRDMLEQLFKDYKDIEKLQRAYTLKQKGEAALFNEIVATCKDVLYSKMINIRDRKMAKTLFEYVKQLKKKQTILVMCGATHEITLRPFLQRYIGKMHSPVNYKTFQDYKKGKCLLEVCDEVANKAAFKKALKLFEMHSAELEKINNKMEEVL